MSKRSKISPIKEGEPHHAATLFVEGIPETTKNAFKAACALKDVTIRDCVITLMREFVAKTNSQ